jgi:hypothetical protein
MGFDPQTEDKPLVNVQRRTTKVNMAIIAGVAIFLIAMIAVALSIGGSSAETRQDFHEEAVQP